MRPFLLLLLTGLFSTTMAQAIEINLSEPLPKLATISQATKLKITNRTAGSNYIFSFKSADGQVVNITTDADLDNSPEFELNVHDNKVFRVVAGAESLLTNFAGSFPITFGANLSGGGNGLVHSPVAPAANIYTLHQVPYLDAEQINSILDEADNPGNRAALIRILAFYLNVSEKAETVKAALIGNKFLNGVNDIVRRLDAGAGQSLTPNTLMSGAGAGSTGVQAGGLSNLINPTTAIDALGTFIAKRFKEEINIAYLYKFREELDKKQSLKLIFPRTADVLLKIEPYNYTSFLQTMQEAFDEDLRRTPRNILLYLDYIESTNKGIIGSNEKAFRLMQVIVEAADSLNQGRTAQFVLGSISSSEYLKKINDDKLRIPFQLTSWLVRSLNADGEKLLSGQQIANLSTNPRLAALFIGLSMEGNEKDFLLNAPGPTGPVDLYAKLNSLSNDVVKVVRLVSKVRKQLEVVAQSQELIKKTSGDNDARILAYITLTSGVVDLLQTAVQGAEQLNIKIGLPITDKTFETSRKILSVVRNTIEKRYGLALTGGVAIVTTLLDKSKMTDNEKNNLGIDGYVGRIMRYGNFMVTVVNAKSTEEMLQALETAALPVGSYRIKRNNFFNISLNAYGGAFVGIESARETNDNKTRKGAFSFAPTAPIGLALSWGEPLTDKSTKQDGSSISIFLSLIDVGAVFSFRLQNDNLSTLPELAWKNVMAPGIHLVHGIRNSPLSWSLGFQYGPQLRKLDVAKDEVQSTINTRAWRIGGTLFVDIPLFNLYTKRER